ncbi:MAG: immunoglobulin domain-containing protein [Verrucomicrobiales bacterium]|nr:immunoglobulin domain-containing protein [Verrucomicrobiales bacterium]
MKRSSVHRYQGWFCSLAAACCVAATADAHAGHYKRITVDGTFSDWAGVPVAHEDPADAPAASDYRRIWVANDEDYLYVRFTLESPQDPFTANDNLFVDADNDPSTGFAILVGSELLVQGGAGYQERNGGFNEGGIDGLDWQGAPSGPGTEFEFRISRRAKFAADGSSVFLNPQIALLLEAEDANFTRQETAPDSEGLIYEFAEKPGQATGTRVLLSFSENWRYATPPVAPSDAWQAPEFDDVAAGWSTGSPLFGHTGTPASYPLAIATPLPTDTRTIYLRRTFNWAFDPIGVDLILTNYLSGGAAFYLNGEEVRRVRLPAGPLTSNTRATGAPRVLGQAEPLALPSGALVVGENLLAIEVHANPDFPTDLVFGASLTATTEYPVVIPDPDQPIDRSVVAGQSTTFSVEHLGSQPISYQWLKAGAPIPDATNATLTLEPVLADDAGAYSVRISNPQTPAGVTSRSAVLTVLSTPVAISQAPAAQQVAEGLSLTLTVVATGSAPLSYQWFKDSQPIAGATNATFLVERTRLEDSGQYQVEVSNPAPSSVRSTAVSVVIVRDNTPPALARVEGSPNLVVLHFSEPVEETAAAVAANYSLSGGVPVVSVRPLSADRTTVTLVTGKQTLGTRYQVTVSNLRDLFGNIIPNGTRRAFVSTILVDGTFEDWDGVPQVVDDPEDAENATDYAAAWIANDADHVYLRVRLHRPSNLGIFYNNLFLDADNDVATGFLFRSIGSEMLIQGGGGYQQKGGGFNEGGIQGLDWLMAPEGVASEFEVRLSRRATYASDGLPVFVGEMFAFYLESENTSFQTVDVAPDAEPVIHTFTAVPPSDLASLAITRSEPGLRITWDGPGRLQSTDRLDGAWQDVTGASSPYTASNPTGSARFYRLIQ